MLLRYYACRALMLAAFSPSRRRRADYADDADDDDTIYADIYAI